MPAEVSFVLASGCELLLVVVKMLGMSFGVAMVNGFCIIH